MINFFSKHKIISALIVLIILVIAFFIFKSENGKQTFTVAFGSLVQEVSATGKVKPTQNVDLGFDRSGRVGAVYAFVGDFVKKGDKIASLESLDVDSDVLKAEAQLEEEILKLSEIERSTPLTYQDSIRALEVAIREAFIVSDNAVRNRADQFFKNVPQNPQFEVTFTDGNFIHYFPVPSNTAISLNNERKQVEEILKYWSLMKDTPSKGDLYQNVEKGILDLKKILTFLDNVAFAMNTFTPSNYSYETTVTTYKGSISTARTDVSNILASLVSARDKFNNAPKVAEGSNQFEAVLVQRSKVEQARANLLSYSSVLNKSVIVAPFDGVVTVQDAKVGGAVSAGQKLVSLTSKQNVYIEANISEINIGKVSVGNPVSIRLDAFPEEDFTGFVSFIEPGDLIIEGVVNYKIRVEFGNTKNTAEGGSIYSYNNVDERIKNGLTANLKIKVSNKENVLKIPAYTITKDGEEEFVNKSSTSGKPIKTMIKTGFVGSDGFVEVLEGLNEGDIIIF